MTDDEFTVLMIAERGEPMIPIGRWEKPTNHLVELGYLKPLPSAGDPTGKFNCVITPEGRTACQQRDSEDDVALAAVLNKVRSAAAVQKRGRDAVENAAQTIAGVAEESSAVTGDTPRSAAKRWLTVLETRLKEILHG